MRHERNFAIFFYLNVHIEYYQARFHLYII